MLDQLLNRYTARQWLSGLLAVALLLLLLDLLLYFFDPWSKEHLLRRLMDITLEANIPTLYSSALAVLAGSVAWQVGRLGGGVGWLLVAAFFTFLGIDDLFMLHERLGSYAGELAHGGAQGWVVYEWLREFRSYYWHVVAAPFFIAAGVLMLLFLRRGFDERSTLWSFIAGLGCYALAMFMDLLDGDISNYGVLAKHTTLALIELRHLERAFEECIEMIGTTVILYAFLRQYRLYSER